MLSQLSLSSGCMKRAKGMLVYVLEEDKRFMKSKLSKNYPDKKITCLKPIDQFVGS